MTQCYLAVLVNGIYSLCGFKTRMLLGPIYIQTLSSDSAVSIDIVTLMFCRLLSCENYGPLIDPPTRVTERRGKVRSVSELIPIAK